jgi:hypothetical protein
MLGAVSLIAAAAGSQNGPPTAAGPYHPVPQHPWNRLHHHLQVRTAVDGREFGLDEVDPLLWRETKHLLSGPSHTQALGLLDEFLRTAGDRLISDPLKRAVLQHDLWAVFDWAAAPRFDGRDERARTALMTSLARVIRRLALTRAQIEQLPNTYADAARSDASLPADLVSAEGKWVPIVGLQPIARQHASGLSRSVFSVLWSVPGGAGATTAYWKQLWEFPTPYVPSPLGDVVPAIVCCRGGEGRPRGVGVAAWHLAVGAAIASRTDRAPRDGNLASGRSVST